jgi:hypothetical protein
MHRKIQYILKPVYRSLSRDQSYRFSNLVWQELVFMLQIGDPFFLNLNSGLNGASGIIAKFHILRSFHCDLSFQVSNSEFISLIFCDHLVFIFLFYSVIFIVQYGIPCADALIVWQHFVLVHILYAFSYL